MNPRRRRAPRPAKALSKPQRKAVKAIVKGSAETKRSMWYQDFNGGSATTRATGLFATRGFAVQNSVISSNETDILRLIPAVAQGTDTFTRIGDRITPIALNVRGVIRVNSGRLNAVAPTDVDVYIYVLQHVGLKNYDDLYAKNDFNQLLDIGVGSTKEFTGEETDPTLPIANSYYKLLKKKKITLRYSGETSQPGLTPPTVGNYVSQANAHSWHASYSMSLGKHLPKTLKYPEPTASTNPVIPAAPTNSSLFMCMSFVNWPNPSNWTSFGSTLAYIEQTYTSELLYKDN